jgi:hypothetical protein
VGVWINEAHLPGDGGKPWKHGDPHCPRLQQRARAGFPIRKVRNPDNRKPVEQHVRRRCDVPGCFDPREKLRGRQIPDPAWLRKARGLEHARPASTWWVYLLSDSARKQFQVGKAKDLHQRLRSRFRATLKGGFDRADGIPWLHDRMAEDLAYEPEFERTAGTTAATADQELAPALTA